VIFFLLATVSVCLRPFEMMMTVISNVTCTLNLSVIFLIVSQNIKELWICAQNSSVYEIGCHIFGSS